MASQKQIAANQENAQKSTGPRTEQGKQISGRNSTRHGLAGRVPRLSEEDQLLYARLGQRYIRDLKPVGIVEEELVRAIQDCHWQLDRARELSEDIMTALLVSSAAAAAPAAGTDEDEPAPRAGKPAAPPSLTLDQLSRYESRIQRTLNQTLSELRKKQNERKTEEQQDAIWKFEQRRGAPYNPKRDRVKAPDGFVPLENGPYLTFILMEREILSRWSAETNDPGPASTANPSEPAPQEA